MTTASPSFTAIILAAGYATRLYPLTLNLAKPLLKIRPAKAVIDFIVDDLEAQRKDGAGLCEIIVVTNHRFFPDFSRWAARRANAKITVVVDDGTTSNEDRLGAIGDIYFALKKRRISGDVVVIGGDNLFAGGFGPFLRFAAGHKPFSSIGLFDIGSRKQASCFGVVSVDARNRVIAFEEKPHRPKSTLVAACLYYFPAATLFWLEKYVRDGSTSKDAPGNYIRWLSKKEPVYGFILKKGFWYDIGHLEAYKEVVKRFN